MRVFICFNFVLNWKSGKVPLLKNSGNHLNQNRGREKESEGLWI